jgi:DNA-directed RNA polymerase subunit M/transcription elongation factor TFIIS
MLYPKEDKVNRVLLYACRNCEHVEQADLKQIDKDGYEVSTGAAWRIYRNEITQKPAYVLHPHPRRPASVVGRR